MEKNKITIVGYMPVDSTIKVTEASTEKTENKINDGIEDLVSPVHLTVAYDVKIISEEKEYEPEDFDENAKITFSGFNQDSINIWHLKNDDTIEKINNNQTTSFSTYGIEVIENNENNTSEESENNENIESGDNNQPNKNPSIMKVIRASENNSDEVLIIDDYNADYNYT